MAKLGNIALIAVVGVAGLGLAAHSFAQGSGSEKMGHGFGPRGEGPPAFETLDTNADGVVTVDEIRALEAAKFAEADTNGDGVLDQDELLEHAVAQMRERAGEMLSRMIAWQMGWMAPAPIGVAIRHIAVVINCSAEEPRNARYNSRPRFGEERFSGPWHYRRRRGCVQPAASKGTGVAIL